MYNIGQGSYNAYKKKEPQFGSFSKLKKSENSIFCINKDEKVIQALDGLSYQGN